MERKRVSSSNIRTIGYDPQDQTLELEFLNGGIYQYLGAPQTVYERLMAASSKGRFVSAHIRDKYRIRKLR
jgi:KTSC domain